MCALYSQSCQGVCLDPDMCPLLINMCFWLQTSAMEQHFLSPCSDIFHLAV